MSWELDTAPEPEARAFGEEAQPTMGRLLVISIIIRGARDFMTAPSRMEVRTCAEISASSVSETRAARRTARVVNQG